ncbi:D-alanyl-D-alanine carboxypeptidase/D-alanyl-D-alanine endopeptidase [Cellulomonas hominis]
MPRAARAVGVGVLVVVLAGGAYGTADAYDLAPGVLTLAPVPAPAAPFPTAGGAVEPAAVHEPLGQLDAAAPVPDAAQVDALVQGLVTGGRLGPSLGVVVTDQLTGEVLAAHVPEQGRTPASTAKLVTAVAALTELDPARTLTTRVLRGPGSQVVLVGGGDMMLAAGAGDPGAVSGRAGLADLAAQVAGRLKLEGTTTVTLGVDDSLFSGPAISPTWDPADIAAGYAAPVTALAVDIAGLTDAEYPPRAADPSLAAAAIFATRLTEQGITVIGSPARADLPAGENLLGSVESAPLVDIVHFFLDSSDNTITEVVSRLVALSAGLPGSFEGGTQAVLRTVTTAGVDVTGAHLSDASGLGDGSVLPPDLLLGLLELITDPAHPVLREVATGMPIGGLTGTLADRFTTTAARGMVRAKTGSLKSVTSLAGTVQTADGRELLFVVMADQTGAVGQWTPRAAVDEFVSTLARCGCST